MKYLCLLLSCILIVSCVGQGPPGTPAPSETPPPQGRQPLSDAEILNYVQGHSFVVLYFYSPTCGTCKTVEPMVEELEKKHNIPIIWVSKQDNQAIYDLYKVKRFPAIYILDIDSEVLVSFDENESLDFIYSEIKNGNLRGMHKLEYTVEGGNLVIPTQNMVPDTLYYIVYDQYMLHVYISPSAALFVFSGATNCYSRWLYLDKNYIFDGESHTRWKKETLALYGGDCGDLILIPYTVTGSAIVVNPADLR